MRIVVRMTVRTNLLLPRELLDEVDRYAGARGRSRYVAEALTERLKRDRLRESVRATAGAWRDHPLFPTSDAVVTWIRERRAETTAPGPDDE
jgi:hypothetical protein